MVWYGVVWYGFVLFRMGQIREAFKKFFLLLNLGNLPIWMGRMTQPPYLVIRSFKTSHFLKVTPLIWASEGQNNESKSNKATQLLGGRGGQPSFGK